jgi:16S rRNA C1402 (ribose-2'-O) methylase RsmI
VDKFLEELKGLEFAGMVGIFRELSKMYEQKLIGTVDELLALRGNKLVAKGEFVIGIYPAKDKEKGKRNKYPKEEQ